MLTKEQVQEAENFEPELTENAGVIARADTGTRKAAPAPATFAGGHQNIATALLREMFDRNVSLAGRMLAIGDTASAKRLLQSAITQCDQIASYRPQISPINAEQKPTIEI